jgi:4-amino-4-deoxy-L-arabinose transferase-like glycosyltransferase
MSYIGTLKSWIYTPLFLFTPPTATTIRFPMLLAGAVTVWLTFLLVRRLYGGAAGVAAAWILATDPLYLLTTVFDWGPTALQILLVVAAVLSGAKGKLWAAGFFLGLALWNKALAGWALAGLILALSVYWRDVYRILSASRAFAPVLALLLGALPLLIYNLRGDFSTFRGNASFGLEELGGKLFMLQATLDGSGLFGWMVEGRSSGTLFLYAFGLALALLPMAGRFGWFSLIFLAVTWALMAATRGAGGAVHHTILLWPFPIVLAVAAYSGAARRVGRFGPRVMAAAAAILVISNLVVVREYHSQMRRGGGALNWTDAIYPLAARVQELRAPAIYTVDWGIFDSLRLLGAGSLPLHAAVDLTGDRGMSGEQKKAMLHFLSLPGAIFLAHTPGNEFYPAINRRLGAFAAAQGYRRETIATVSDRNGRPRFEIFRFTGPQPSPAPAPTRAHRPASE